MESWCWEKWTSAGRWEAAWVRDRFCGRGGLGVWGHHLDLVKSKMWGGMLHHIKQECTWHEVCYIHVCLSVLVTGRLRVKIPAVHLSKKLTLTVAPRLDWKGFCWNGFQLSLIKFYPNLLSLFVFSTMIFQKWLYSADPRSPRRSCWGSWSTPMLFRRSNLTRMTNDHLIITSTSVAKPSTTSSSYCRYSDIYLLSYSVFNGEFLWVVLSFWQTLCQRWVSQ